MTLVNPIRIQEAMAPMPFSVSAEAPLGQALGMMRSHGVRHLPVLVGGELIGLITERDAEIARTFHGPGYMSVWTAMDDRLYTVGPDETLSSVLAEMIGTRTEAALVTSPRGNVIGIFTTTDALVFLRALVLLGEREGDPESGVTRVPRAA